MSMRTQDTSSQIQIARDVRTSGRGRRLPCMLLLTVSVLMAACGTGTEEGGGGGGGGGGGETAIAIPEQLYEVSLATSTNSCGTQNLPGFLLVTPRNGGTEVTGVLESSVSAVVTGQRGDLLTFSTPLRLVGDTVITLAGKWTFAADRHSFTGPLTLAVSFGGPVVCTFTYASDGRHFPERGPTEGPPLPPAPPEAAPSTSVGEMAAPTSASRVPALCEPTTRPVLALSLQG